MSRKFQELMEKMAKVNVMPSSKLNATNVEEAKREFLANPDMTTPNFQYADLNLADVMERLRVLDGLMQESASAELMELERSILQMVSEFYRERLLFLYHTIMYQQTERFPEERKTVQNEYMRVNVRLYGEPDYRTFRALLCEKLNEVPVGQLSEVSRVQYIQLRERLLGGAPEVSPVYAPSRETVAGFAELLEDFFGEFLAHMPEDKEVFTSEEACAILNEIIRQELPDTTKFRAVVSEKAENISVDQANRRIKIPQHRAKGELSREDVRALLIGHELGVHAYRSIAVEDATIPAIVHGFPDRHGADEGLAKCVEQALRGEYAVSGVYHYINIGLATFRGMNFREVFEAERDLKMLLEARLDETPEEYAVRRRKTENAVFNDVRRCFRGTGVLPNFKDLVYFNGSQQVWRFIEEHIGSYDFLETLFLSGKTDFLDERQRRIAYALKVGEFHENFLGE